MSVHGLFNRPLNSVAHVDYLDLPGIITTQIQETDEQISVKAEEAEQMNKCPNCGKEETLKGDGSPSQGFWDRPDGKPRWVTLRKQIYEWSVCHETCSHELSFLLTPKARISTSPPRARTYCGHQRDQTEGRGETSSMAVSACKSIENPHSLLDPLFYCSYN